MPIALLNPRGAASDLWLAADEVLAPFPKKLTFLQVSSSSRKSVRNSYEHHCFALHCADLWRERCKDSKVGEVRETARLRRSQRT